MEIQKLEFRVSNMGSFGAPTRVIKIIHPLTMLECTTIAVKQFSLNYIIRSDDVYQGVLSFLNTVFKSLPEIHCICCILPPGDGDLIDKGIKETLETFGFQHQPVDNAPYLILQKKRWIQIKKHTWRKRYLKKYLNHFPKVLIKVI